MAAMVQQWVLETGQTAVQSRRGHSYLRGDDFVLKAKVEEVRGSGPYLTRAKTAEGDEVALLLTQGTTEPREGSVVGIKAPTWDVQLEGKTWKVGVDWKTLS